MRLLEYLSGPVALMALALEAARGRTSLAGLGERLSLGIPKGGGARSIWVHAASNGEVSSVRPLIEALVARHADLSVVLTVNTRTALKLAEGFGLPHVIVRLAPVDLRGAVGRFLDRFTPGALVIVENELWPRRMAECAARGIPVIVVGARMSARSADRWQRLPGLARAVTGRIAWLSAQDAASAGRFLAAGLPPERLGPVVNLKSLAVPRPAPLPYPADRQRVILAASTHEGEEAAVIAALVAARATVPDLHLIIAPRHPRRRDEIEAVLRGAGLTFSTRSRGELPDAARDVYLADTLGEMENWYSAAALTFVGGSLTDRGGHTPFEPAAHDSAIVAGPHVGNFREPYCALAADGACLTVHDQHDLAAALARMGEPSFVAGLAQRARVTMARLSSGGLADVLHQIEVLASLGSGGPRESLPGKGFTGR